MVWAWKPGLGRLLYPFWPRPARRSGGYIILQRRSSGNAGTAGCASCVRYLIQALLTDLAAVFCGCQGKRCTSGDSAASVDLYRCIIKALLDIFSILLINVPGNWSLQFSRRNGLDGRRRATDDQVQRKFGRHYTSYLKPCLFIRPHPHWGCREGNNGIGENGKLPRTWTAKTTTVAAERILRILPLALPSNGMLRDIYRNM